MDPGQAARLGWQLKAVFDEAYLYIRIEAGAELPAPGSTVKTSPGVWPHLRINTSDAGEFVLFDAVNIGDTATFDEHGKANSHRAYAAYMIRLEQNDHEVFSASADLNPSPLLDVAGRDYDIRIPLAAMGIADSRANLPFLLAPARKTHPQAHVAHATVGRDQGGCSREPCLPRSPEAKIDEIHADQVVDRCHLPERELIES